MAGFSDKIKKITSVLSKKDKKKGADSPFDSVAPSFLQGIPDLGSLPDLSAGLPPVPPGSPPAGPPGFQNAPGAPSFPPGMAPPGVSPGGISQQSSANNEMLEENRKKIKDVEGKISKADVALNLVQKENEEIKKTVDKIDQSVLELLSLYEIVSNQVNPFVGDDVASRATIERFDKTDKRITELGDMLVLMKNEYDSTVQKLSLPQGISSEAESRMHNIESKMDAFADAMMMMHESIEQLSSKTEQLFSRTSALDQNVIDLAETTTNISSRLDIFEKQSAVINSVNAAENTDENEESNDSELVVLPKKSSIPMVRLESIKGDPTSVVVLLNWIEFLMERVGRNNLMDALDYYMDIGWISEDVMSEIMAYARGIDYYVEKPTWRLLPEDHTKSLLFIERLSGRKIDRNMLSSIDREMAKVKHGLEELYGI
ncbi:FlaD/FlaE family flagellar protein [Methanolobus mangrovi]|uniref:FlaD/FlaE family flagellar protein n=1 Tax=Methanolobus mangrovi TaxID=3072977 RepID=A0AA51YJ39_9EURY|nr:FlaD/FlaE family flagellar protein [Methanolobus mangrovi]WMW22205.1 FlaD/FlaE family flagellar protein [Methanolobus mangrovi]